MANDKLLRFYASLSIATWYTLVEKVPYIQGGIRDAERYANDSEWRHRSPYSQ